jgi:hypothetical protein
MMSENTPAPVSPPEGGAPAPESGGWYTAPESADLLGKFESADALKGRLVPDTEASEEEWGGFFNTLGRPATPAEYGFDVGEEFKDFALSDDEKGAWAPEFHKLGLTASQADGLVKTYAQITKQQNEALAQQQAEQTKAQEEYIAKLYGSGVEAKVQELSKFNTDVLSVKLPEVAKILTENPEYLKNGFTMQILDYLKNVVQPANTAPAVRPSGTAKPANSEMSELRQRIIRTGGLT